MRATCGGDPERWDSRRWRLSGISRFLVRSVHNQI